MKQLEDTRNKYLEFMSQFDFKRGSGHYCGDRHHYSMSVVDADNHRRLRGHERPSLGIKLQYEDSELVVVVERAIETPVKTEHGMKRGIELIERTNEWCKERGRLKEENSEERKYVMN